MRHNLLLFTLFKGYSYLWEIYLSYGASHTIRNHTVLPVTRHSPSQTGRYSITYLRGIEG